VSWVARPSGDGGWESGEVGWSFAKQETRRLLRRSRPRLRWIILVSLLAAAGFVTKRLWKPPKREAVIRMRAIEQDMERETAVRPAKSYQDYIWGVFFSSTNLLKIVEKHKLYPDRYARDPMLAVEGFRDDIDLQVWRNYFIWEHYEDDGELRTVRFSVSWMSTDPQQALEVVRDLGALIIEKQTEERRQIFEMGQQDLQVASDEAAQRLALVRTEMAKRRLELQRANASRSARLGVELRDLKDEETQLAQRVETMGNTRTRFELTAAWERQHSGMRFETIDPGVVLPRTGGGPKSLAGSAVLVFLGAGFLAAMVFGAFETRIRLPKDVSRLGIPLLGALPPFEGDNQGSLTERLHAEDRLRLESR
jgi:hypothetical protein